MAKGRALESAGVWGGLGGVPDNGVKACGGWGGAFDGDLTMCGWSHLLPMEGCTGR